MPSTLVDSGPLYALFSQKDRHHADAQCFMKTARDRLITNVAVIMEVVYMLRHEQDAQRKFLNWARVALSIDAHTADDFTRICELFAKYADLPADFADASLVAMAERQKVRRIATVDRDFLIYRMHGKHPFENVFWPS